MPAQRSAPSVDLSMLLNQSSYAVANRLTAALEGVGISVRAYCVLVKAIEGEYTQGQLSELAWMDKSTMVVTLDELERLGLAERRLSPTDRRVRVVAVTAAGKRALTKADKVVQGVYDDILGGVSEQGRAAFLRVLDGLVVGPLATPFHMEKQTVRRRKQRSAA